MTTPKLNAPRITAILDNGEDDPKPLEVQTTNADMVLWDRTRVKHRWPNMQDAPFLGMTFVAWAAARRTGLIAPDLTYEAWEAKVLDLSVEDDETTEVEAFPPVPGAAS